MPSSFSPSTHSHDPSVLIQQTIEEHTRRREQEQSQQRCDFEETEMTETQRTEVIQSASIVEERERSNTKEHIRETARVKERSSTDKRSGCLPYSISVQDISSIKSCSTPFDEGTKGRVNLGKDHKRVRATSVQRDVPPFDQDRIVDGRGGRTRKRHDTSTIRDPIIEELTKELELTKNCLKNAKQKNLELHRTNNDLLLEWETTAKKFQTDVNQRFAELQARNRRQEEEIHNLKAKVCHAEEKISETTNLLRVRTTALRGAESFLTTADQYSGSDIINMVNILNAEIFQAAAYIADFLEDPSTVATDDRKRKYTPLLEDARSQIGNGLFEYFLEKGVHVRVDPLPLQLAIQSIFSCWCAFLVHRFCNNGAQNELTRLYQEVQNREIQTVSGRWRAITYAHMKVLDSQTYSDQVLDTIIGLLCLCGWSLNSPPSQKAILVMQKKVKALEKSFQKLKSATKEGITSADIDVFVIDFDRSYDDSKMEDSYSSNKSATQIVPEMRVLCTVGLGLKRTVVKRASGTPEKQEDILMKPKVALKTVLRDIGSDIDSVTGNQVSGSSRLDGRP